MTIRKAVAGDCTALAKLRRQQLIDEGDTPSDVDFAAYFRSAITDGSFVAWLAEDSGEICATSGLCFYHLPPSFTNPSGRVAYVTNMFTQKEYRRQGIATALLKLVLDEAQRQGCTVARLHASNDGRGLYLKLGFTASDGYMSLRL